MWCKRESRLHVIISGAAGLSIAVLLLRECPDPPVENDPDTDEESKQAESKVSETTTKKTRNKDYANTEDPTIRPWDSRDLGRWLSGVCDVDLCSGGGGV